MSSSCDAAVALSHPTRNGMDSSMSGAKDWLQAELEDSFDEEIELELEDAVLSREIARIYKDRHPDMIDRRA